MTNILKTTVFNEHGHEIYSLNGAPAVKGEDVLTISYIDEGMLETFFSAKSIEYKYEDGDSKKFYCEYHGSTYYLDDVFGIDILLLQGEDYSIKREDKIHIGEVH